jgi:hypothetical protein
LPLALVVTPGADASAAFSASRRPILKRLLFVSISSAAIRRSASSAMSGASVEAPAKVSSGAEWAFT